MTRMVRRSALSLLATLAVGLSTYRTSAFQLAQYSPAVSKKHLSSAAYASTSSTSSSSTCSCSSSSTCSSSSRRPSVKLYSSNGLQSSNDDRPQTPKGGNPIVRVVKKLVNARARLWARFLILPKKAKRILMVNMLFFMVACGGVSRSIYTQSAPSPPVEVSYSSFLDLVEQQHELQNGKASTAATGNVPVMDQVRIGNDRIIYRLYRNVDSKQVAPAGKTPSRRKAAVASRQAEPYLTAYTRKVPASQELVNSLRTSQVSFAAAAAPRMSVLTVALRTFMISFYCLILFRLYQNVQGAGGAGGGGKDTPGKLAQTNDLPLASFDDIQGIDQAKVEVMELVDALRNPDKYAILGARAPTGLLLEGPPGTGKTMLARATAASAGIPLLYCSGSDFVEMFVGRGAARVRKMFERASKLSPCIIFIDELDALGKARDMGGMGGAFSRSNDEAEQTLNQLLACMDGLDSSRRICVLAATNRKEVLDQALIRPGRFDRIVKLQLPDAAGREGILRVHAIKLPGFVEGTGIDSSRPGSLGKGRVVDLSALAALTDGFSGAELEFLVNEAAIRAVRRVSSALREGSHADDITPQVEAGDFEASLINFFQTRKPKNLWQNVFK